MGINADPGGRDDLDDQAREALRDLENLHIRG